MRRHLPVMFLLFAAIPSLPAADKETPLDAKYLRDHSETRGFMLGRPTKARPTPDGKAVLFLRAQPRSAKNGLFEFDVASSKTRELLTPEQVLKGAEEKLSPEEKARRERMRVSGGGFADYQLNDDGSLILLSLSGRLYVVGRANALVRELKTGAGTIVDPKFSPDGKSVAYVKDYDVFVYDLAADKEKPITTGGTEEKSHGLAEFVAQEEMGRFSGYWWSPDSKHIVYEEADHKGVEVWYVADPAQPGRKPQPFFYPRPGKPNVQVRVGIIAVPSPLAGEGKGEGKTIWIDWDREKYEYLAQVRWEEYGPLTLTVQNRLQNELVLLKADPATGKTTPLLTEKDETWVNLHQDTPRWLANNKGFLWTSDAGKAAQLQLHAADGRFQKVVVKSIERLVYFHELVAVDEKGRTVGSDNPVIWSRSSWRDGSITLGAFMEVKLGELPPPEISFGLAGLQTASFSKNSATYVLSKTDATHLPKATVCQGNRRDQLKVVVADLPSVAEEPGFVPKVEFTKISGLCCAIVRPHGFDPKKKYPVIVNVYGGPGHQMVVQAMRNWLLPQWLADQGFVVVSIDNRGTPGRGRDFERAIYKKFGSVTLEDQVAALQGLANGYPELDLARVGIFGWSFGGYMAALAVLKRPDVFHAAVAGAPVTDWLDYDTHYTERYLGLPEENPEAYKDASLLTYAPNLKRPLLLIHGTADDNVYFRHSLKLADALFRSGRDFELLPLPGLTHMVPEPVVMERLWLRIAGHFQKHLVKK